MKIETFSPGSLRSIAPWEVSRLREEIRELRRLLRRLMDRERER